MKLSLLAALFCFAVSGFAQEYRLGSQVGGFRLQDLAGKPVNFSSLKGDTTAILFVSTKCPISNDYLSRMKEIHGEYTSKGVKFVFINANQNEPASEVEEHAKHHQLPFPTYKDANNEVADRFGAQFTPEVYVLDKTGALRYHGYIDDSRNPARISKQGLRLALDAVMAGKPVASAETKAFGCTIKRVKKIS